MTQHTNILPSNQFKDYRITIIVFSKISFNKNFYREGTSQNIRLNLKIFLDSTKLKIVCIKITTFSRN